MDQITSSYASFFLQQKLFIKSRNLFSPGSVICNKCRLLCSREMGLAKSNNTDPDHFLCVPRKDPDYAPPHKLAENAPKSPPNITLPIPSVVWSHSLCARDGVQIWWLYQIVLGINFFWTNLHVPQFLSEQDAVHGICLTIILIIMQSYRFIQLEQHQISITQVWWNYQHKYATLLQEEIRGA